MPKCPKIIHFIWAGGEAILPDKGILVVSAWAKTNPDFIIYLWVDVKTCGKPFQILLDNYKEAFKKHPIDVLINPSDARSHLASAAIFLKDVTGEGLRNELVTYELDQLIPNYGASSDLLRYAILFKYGGAYFDCTDVQPHPSSSLQTSNIFKETNNHVLYVNHLSQNPMPEPVDYLHFVSDTIGNDAFICTEQNPLILKFIQAAIVNYNLKLNEIGIIVMYGHASHHSKVATISRTGPGLVRNVLGKEGVDFHRDGNCFLKKIDEAVVHIRPMNTPDLKLTQPEFNTRFWLAAQDNPTLTNLSSALLKTIFAIDFEATHFHYLLLEYHTNKLARVVGIQPGEALKHIISELLKSDDIFYQQITFAPLIGICPEAKDFIRKHSLMTNWGININGILMGVRIETNIIDIQSGYNQVSELLNIIDPRVRQGRLTRIRDNEKNEWLAKISYGTRYIEFLASQDEMRGHKDAVQFYEMARIILTEYNKFAKLLKDTYPSNPAFVETAKKVTAIFLQINTILNQLKSSNNQTPRPNLGK